MESLSKLITIFTFQTTPFKFHYKNSICNIKTNAFVFGIVVRIDLDNVEALVRKSNSQS